MSNKGGACHKDTGVKVTPSKMGCSLKLVSLLQVYFLITYRTSQGLYLLWEEFV